MKPKNINRNNLNIHNFVPSNLIFFLHWIKNRIKRLSTHPIYLLGQCTGICAEIVVFSSIFYSSLCCCHHHLKEKKFSLKKERENKKIDLKLSWLNCFLSWKINFYSLCLRLYFSYWILFFEIEDREMTWDDETRYTISFYFQNTTLFLVIETLD